MNPLYCQCKSANVCGRNVTSKLAPINLIRSGQVERRRTQASKRQPWMHGTEALQVRHPIPSRTERLRPAAIRIKRATATGPASERRLDQARLEGGYVR